MTVHPVQDASVPDAVPQGAPTDTLRAGQATAYDSTWATEEVPAQQLEGLERVMLPHDKIYVVLAVVLIIWLGLAFLIYRTDRRLARLERTVERDIPNEHDS